MGVVDTHGGWGVCVVDMHEAEKGIQGCMDERWSMHAYLLLMSMDHFLSPPFGAEISDT